jgi:predicted TIM-barrel fold metal-dependent hydrolase
MPFPRLSDVAVARETLVTIGREQRISADSHMTEPPDLWEKRLPPALRDRAPRFPNRGDAGGNVRVGGWDPCERLKDQAYDSVSAEVLYPTRGTVAWVTGDPELEEACCRVYNDWLIEFCSAAPQRLWGLAMISLWNIEHAAQELERCRKGGLRGATIGLVPAEDLLYGSDHYERFWAACQDLAMSVNLHINSGPGRMKFSPQQRSGLMPDGAAGHKWDCMKAVGNMVAHGCFRAIPRPEPGGRRGWRGVDPVLRPGVRLLPDELRSVAHRSGAAARHPPAAQRVHLSAGLRSVHSGPGRLQAASRVWMR